VWPNCCGINIYLLSVDFFRCVCFIIFSLLLENYLSTLLQFFQLCGAKSSEGVFVGAFLSMSSTAVVINLFKMTIIQHSYLDNLLLPFGMNMCLTWRLEIEGGRIVGINTIK
jgi:hypothetical protein